MQKSFSNRFEIVCCYATCFAIFVLPTEPFQGLRDVMSMSFFDKTDNADLLTSSRLRIESGLRNVDERKKIQKFLRLKTECETNTNEAFHNNRTVTQQRCCFLFWISNTTDGKSFPDSGRVRCVRPFYFHANRIAWTANQRSSDNQSICSN